VHGAARRGREVALQMLYQWEVGHTDIEAVLQSYWELEPPGSAPGEDARTFAEQLARGTTASLTVSDPLIADEAEHWRLSRMAVIDRLILRLAVYELLHSDTPRPVIINEAIELSKKFSTDDSAKFINGVLDAVRRRLEAGG
jgi:transcription antitermination protein NusB